MSSTCLEKKETPKIKIGFKRHFQYCPFHRRLKQGEAELTSRSRTGFTLILFLDKRSNFEIWNFASLTVLKWKVKMSLFRNASQWRTVKSLRWRSISPTGLKPKLTVGILCHDNYRHSILFINDKRFTCLDERDCDPWLTSTGRLEPGSRPLCLCSCREMWISQRAEKPSPLSDREALGSGGISYE